MSAITTYRGYTLAAAQADLELWRKAERAVATGQAYSIGSRQLTRAGLRDIKAKIDELLGIIDVLSGGHSSPVRVYARKSRW